MSRNTFTRCASCLETLTDSAVFKLHLNAPFVGSLEPKTSRVCYFLIENPLNSYKGTGTDEELKPYMF